MAEELTTNKDYNSLLLQAVAVIKSAIQQSRYNVMRNANKETLALYYGVGRYLSLRSASASWGDKVLDAISAQLQQELPGLRGFSKTSIKKMRKFYEEWQSVFGPLVTNQLDNGMQLIAQSTYNEDVIISPLTTDQFDDVTMQAFLSVQFTHHYELVLKTSSLDERLFYIRRIASEFWSVDKLKYNLGENLYAREGSMPNNFTATIQNEVHKEKAMRAFRKDYQLDFMHIDDPDDWDELRVEDEIVQNIKKFIMALGADFTFMGNQYRLIVDDQEYFIDLLFFNRRLQSLVAIELKWTDFKPEYVGKMNFYLSALDDMVRLPHENPSIGIILCRGQKLKTVEYALRDSNKPMGVATYRAANELPEEYGAVLGELEGLKELV